VRVPNDETPMGATYARVIVVEVVVLIALWLLQAWFSR
jgi:hypothetical protein